MPKIIDPVFAKTSPKRSFSVTEYERVGLVFTKTRVYKFGHWKDRQSLLKQLFQAAPTLSSIPFLSGQVVPVTTSVTGHPPLTKQSGQWTSCRTVADFLPPATAGIPGHDLPIKVPDSYSNGVEHHLRTLKSLQLLRQTFCRWNSPQIRSPWASPLHLVRKPDRSWRPCGNN